jgi:methylated-DNA-[protein]-cysteine S-methyltransferase
MASAAVWWRQPTPLGDAIVVVNDRGVRRLELGVAADGAPPDEALDAVPERDDDIARELDEYFAGTRRSFSAGADLSYVDPAHFGRRVLETLASDVPWGETVTYGELADMVGAPRAARAVGNVMAHNPVQILLPCHRVVAAAGIGGYGSSGVAMKRALLALEGVELH